jgi:hypothetical protein
VRWAPAPSETTSWAPEPACGPLSFSARACTFGATEPSAPRISVRSTSSHLSPFFTRTGASARSSVTVPSGLTKTWVVSVRLPVASTRRPQSFAAIAAEATSVRPSGQAGLAAACCAGAAAAGAGEGASAADANRTTMISRLSRRIHSKRRPAFH